MKAVILRGKTRKGKNRISNNGKEWIIVEERERVACLCGPGILLRSTSTNEIRWIKKDDPDFEIVGIT